MPRASKAGRQARTSKRRAGQKGRKTHDDGAYPISMPSVMPVTLRYQDVYSTGTLNAGSPNLSIIWRPNDLYDPLYSGAGHQSMLRDQWYALYHWGRCTGFDFGISMINTSLSPVHVIMVLLEDLSTITYEQAAEMRNSQRTVVTSSKPAKLSVSCLVDKFLGNRPGTSLTDDQFKEPSTASLDVKATAWLHVYYKFFPVAGSAELLVSYDLKQRVQFSEPVIQAQS